MNDKNDQSNIEYDLYLSSDRFININLKHYHLNTNLITILFYFKVYINRLEYIFLNEYFFINNKYSYLLIPTNK